MSWDAAARSARDQEAYDAESRGVAYSCINATPFQDIANAFGERPYILGRQRIPGVVPRCVHDGGFGILEPSVGHPLDELPGVVHTRPRYSSSWRAAVALHEKRDE